MFITVTGSAPYTVLLAMTLSPLWVGVGVPSSPTLVCVHVLGKGFIPLIIFNIIILSLQVLPSVTIDPVTPTTTNKCVETESACNGIVKVSPMNCKQLRSHTHALCKQCINYFFLFVVVLQALMHSVRIHFSCY